MKQITKAPEFHPLITQGDAHTLLAAAKQVIWKLSHSGWKCSHDETIEPVSIDRRDATIRMLMEAVDGIENNGYSDDPKA